MEQKKIGVVFPGYGQQFIGMGKELYDEVRLVQELFEQAAGLSDINFIKLIFASSEKDIFQIKQGYLSIYLFQAALYELLYQKGLRPDFLAGHGIGEYAACFASRSLSFIDGFYILNKYAQFYQEFVQDKPYAALRIVREFDTESIEDLCIKSSTKTMHAYVSAQNSAQAFYVAGHQKVIEKIQKYCLKKIIRKVRVIDIGYGLHSQLADSLVAQLKLYYHKIQFKNLQIPVITNVDGVYVTSSDALESAIMRKINHRNQWFSVMQGFAGCDVILSVGPGDQLIEWFKEIYPDKEYHIIQTDKDIASIAHLYNGTANTSCNTVAESNLYDSDIVNELASDFDVDDNE